jgi:hypothetical protein
MKDDLYKGQRSLSPFPDQDLHQEVVVPAAAAAFHGEAALARVLFQQRQREAVSVDANRYCSGERGIRTPGTL